MNSTIMKATASMTGGSNAPPADAEDSIAAARTAETPTRFISGMVIGPVVTTSAVGLPEIDP